MIRSAYVAIDALCQLICHTLLTNARLQSMTVGSKHSRFSHFALQVLHQSINQYAHLYSANALRCTA